MESRPMTIERRREQAEGEFNEIVGAGGVADVWVVERIADVLAVYLSGEPAVWGKFQAMVEAKAAHRRFDAYLRANPAVGPALAVRAAQDAFPEWAALDVIDASQHGLIVEAESAGQRRNILVVRGAGGEWVCQMGDVSVGVPAGAIQ